ncbi:N-acetylneuraminate synthase [Vibrio variabilis]|uniref:N-acetylneuraminate synthase n=1 Tax=Vibrio variabilis TaxID=990271 RepID=A0ABQ0JFM8_9VIBR|nr:N-acetylneuraminate synthase [Vibrio variabilis]
MPNQIQVIALIPARGGSQELPRKNIRPLAGKPLIAWTIEAAKRATSIDRVFVSTEDPEIRKIALVSGAEVIDRPLELASHTASLEPVISHAIEVLKSRDIKFSHLCLLQPTSPLRTHEHIDKAVEILASHSASGVISVTQSAHSATKAYRQNKDGSISGLFTVDAPYARRQDLPESYFANGAIYLFNHKAFALNQQIPREKMLPYLMPSDISHDIDNLSDFEAIERQITHSHPHKIRPLNINGRLVGPDHPPLVIAEIGINHEGSLKTALEMVDAAHSAGAEVIKHQTHIVDDEMSMAAKKTIPGNTDVSIYEVMERCALTEEEELELKRYVERKRDDIYEHSFFTSRCQPPQSNGRGSHKNRFWRMQQLTSH